jgi:uncharacterized membrane protein
VHCSRILGASDSFALIIDLDIDQSVESEAIQNASFAILLVLNITTITTPYTVLYRNLEPSRRLIVRSFGRSMLLIRHM